MVKVIFHALGTTLKVPSGSKFFSLREVPILDAIEDNHYLIQ